MIEDNLDLGNTIAQSQNRQRCREEIETQDSHSGVDEICQTLAVEIESTNPSAVNAPWIQTLVGYSQGLVPSGEGASAAPPINLFNFLRVSVCSAQTLQQSSPNNDRNLLNNSLSLYNLNIGLPTSISPTFMPTGYLNSSTSACFPIQRAS